MTKQNFLDHLGSNRYVHEFNKDSKADDELLVKALKSVFCCHVSRQHLISLHCPPCRTLHINHCRYLKPPPAHSVACLVAPTTLRRRHWC
ncbi:hypothetical protein TNCV_2820521 [Trichonephila clavipes]|nr:hypothetical protein TNCV_2820521 [Trichonephila clavipes]